MANYPQELAQDAAYQSNTSRLTELWFLPKPAQGLNTYNNIYIYIPSYLQVVVKSIYITLFKLKVNMYISKFMTVQYGLVLRRGYVLQYLVVNRIVVKRVLFKWFKLR